VGDIGGLATDLASVSGLEETGASIEDCSWRISTCIQCLLRSGLVPIGASAMLPMFASQRSSYQRTKYCFCREIRNDKLRWRSM